MHVITGGTGNIGSAVADSLLAKGEEVIIVTHNADKAQRWENKGAKIALADILDTDKLSGIFKQADSVFLLNPPGDITKDIDIEEIRTIHSLLAAIEKSGVKKVVAQSTMGAQPGEKIGDLGTLYQFEQGIAKLNCPHTIIRGAFYMSNWASALQTIEQSGEVVSFYPADLKMPMVAPQDIGELAAGLLLQTDAPELVTIEGPERYSANDVATAFAKALNREVKLKVVPPADYESTYKSLGFSDEAAQSYAGMATLSVKGDFEDPANTVKGPTTLQHFITQLLS